jgi:GTP cyclohydrolase FolE2
MMEKERASVIEEKITEIRKGCLEEEFIPIQLTDRVLVKCAFSQNAELRVLFSYMALPVSNLNGVKVYNLSAGKTLPQWLENTKSVRALRYNQGLTFFSFFFFFF